MRMKGKKPIFNYKDCYSLDMTLSPIICEGLKKFKEYAKDHPFAGYPPDLSKDTDEDGEEAFAWWLAIIDDMIYAFNIKEEPVISDYDFEFTTEWKTLGNGNTELISIDPTDVDEYNRYKKDQEDWYERKKKGLKLFGEYFDSLWI